MALQLGALRDALAEAGASPELARRASEEVAAHDDKLQALRLEIAEVKSDVKLMKWMLGTALALIVLVLGKQFGVVN